MLEDGGTSTTELNPVYAENFSHDNDNDIRPSFIEKKSEPKENLPNNFETTTEFLTNPINQELTLVETTSEIIETITLKKPIDQTASIPIKTTELYVVDSPVISSTLPSSNAQTTTENLIISTQSSSTKSSFNSTTNNHTNHHQNISSTTQMPSSKKHKNNSVNFSISTKLIFIATLTATFIKFF